MSVKATSRERHLTVRMADSAADRIAAQRLRYRVFVEELGADGPTVDHANRRERDSFDQWYDHLLLVDRRRNPDDLDHVVGVYRLLRSDVALAGPGFYSAAEYDLGPLLRSGHKLLELGRSCVAADSRGGAGMVLLWNALAAYVLRHEIKVMFGVASYHGTDIAPIARSLSYLGAHHLAPPEMRVRAHADHYQSLDLIPAETISRAQAMAETPALIKAYLRLGGVIGDGAYIDRDFNTTDVCLLMDTERMSARHRASYIRKSGHHDPGAPA